MSWLFFIILFGFLLALYILLIAYQVLQLYYMVNPYKACLLSSNTKKVGLSLKTLIEKHISTSDLETSHFIELGSGKANISRFICKNLNFSKVIGIEGDLLTYLASKFLIKITGKYSNLQIIKQDLLKTDISKLKTKSGVNVIYCYLFPALIQKLYERGFFANSILITLTFDIENVTPLDTVKINNFQKNLYLYDFRKK